jgi:hypothetical protein
MEIPLHRRVRREIRRQRAPLAAGPGDVKNRVNDFAQAGAAVAPAVGGRCAAIAALSASVVSLA